MSHPTLDVIRKHLGEPAFDAHDVLLYEVDCVNALAALPDGCLSLTVTSPPYNIGKEYESRMATAAYLDWCAKWIHEVFRVTADDGTFWLNLGYCELPGRARAIPIPYMLWDRIPFFLMQEVVWHYGAGVASKKAFSPRNEKFLWYVKDPNSYYFDLDAVRDPNVKYPKQFKNGRLKVNPLGKNPSDVWEFPKVTSGKNRSSSERAPHPAQFPRAVIERILRATSARDAVVLDPFMGSGSTAETAMRRGQPAVGFEIEPTYLEYAMGRLDRVAAELDAEAAQTTLGV